MLSPQPECVQQPKVCLRRAGVAAGDQWWCFAAPLRVIKAQADIPAALETVAAAVVAGAYAVGWLSYEAAPELDAALATQAAVVPKLWFGLFEVPECLSTAALWQRYPRPDYQLEPWQVEGDEAAYAIAIASIKAQIAQGNTYQVNYTLRLNSQLSGSTWGLFHDLVQAQPHAYATYIDTGSYTICSASPELFFEYKHGQVITRPMKGTVPRGGSPTRDRELAHWLQHSAKNQAENVMIVDMMRNDLARIADQITVPALFNLEAHPTLWQMTSTITAQTQAPWQQVLSHLFPCASITGAPKARTMAIIRDLETSPRGVYTGALGYVTPDHEARFSVAIRTVCIDRQGQATYGVGSGIVWDSDASAEYAECLQKTAILSQPRFECLETLRWQGDYARLDLHLDRLERTAAYFGRPYERDSIQHSLLAAAQSLPADQLHKVRLLLHADGQVTLEAQAIQLQPLRVCLAQNPIDSQSPFVYYKTTHRPHYNQALAAQPDYDDVLLWNTDGEITEFCYGNVVIQYQGHWLTPRLEAGLLAGVYRHWLLDQGKIQEAIITQATLAEATAIVLINSVREWQPVIYNSG